MDEDITNGRSRREETERAEEPAPTEDQAPRSAGRSRAKRAVGSRSRFGGSIIGILTLLLGFAIVVQVRANSSDDSLSGLRENDLISILDNQNDRAARLRAQLAELQDTLRRLRDSGDRSAAAREQARQQSAALGVLLGVLPAHGPGVVVTVTDPGGKLDGEALLDVVQELRGAGAEAIQFGPVRVSTDTYFSGRAGAVSVDDTPLRGPYRVLAIGDPKTLDTALNIPGGVAASVRTAGGELTVAQRGRIAVTKTRPLPRTKYAKPK